MKNIPRLFIDQELAPGKTIDLSPEQHHYLTRVMRMTKFLAFNNGIEYEAQITDANAITNTITNHKDPSGKWTFCFAPIKRIEDLISAVTQMGAGALQPVITEYTTMRHINWNRMRKIMIEAAEQSGRNSIPELRAPIPFAELDKKNIIYGDERQFTKCKVQSANNDIENCTLHFENCKLLVGPEGGFSDEEFAALDGGGAAGVSLGPTILRSEVAAIALFAAIAAKLQMTNYKINDNRY